MSFDRFQYLLLLLVCLVVTLPLELVLGARVYRQPGRLVRTIAPVVIVFMIWDAVAIRRHDWWFAAKYVTGWHVPFAIPVEELAFFVVVPLCSLLTYGAVDRICRRWSAKHDA